MDLKNKTTTFFLMSLTELSLCSFNIIEIEVGESYNIYIIISIIRKEKLIIY